MSSKINDNNNDPFVHFNSLISLKLLSDHYHLHAKYLIRMENLEQTLLLKLCESPLLEYSDLKESLFFIRDMDECQSIYGKKKSDDSINFQYYQKNNLKDSGFSNFSILNFNQTFFLQHMMSKKFITIEKLQGNDNYSLKLTSEVESANPFAFKGINETRSSLEPMIYKNIAYLSVFNKEKGQFYFINHTSFDKMNNDRLEDGINNSDEEIEKEVSKEKKVKIFKSNYSDLCLVNTPNDKFSLINQSWYINNNNYLYSGQLINIIFSNIKNKENEKMMLSAKGIKVENTIEEIIGIKEEIREDIDGMLRDNNQKYMEFHGTTDRIKEKINLFSSINIKGLPYEEKLFEHVANNSFWVIEKENTKKDEFEREAIKIGDLIRIKNPLLGLYLQIKKKEKEQKYNNEQENNNNIMGNLMTGQANNNNNSNNNNEDEEYEFELVNEETLGKRYYNYNFKFFHYNANEENQNMVGDGKYVLKSVFRVLNESNKNLDQLKKFDFKETESYFEPIFLTVKNENDSVSIKIEDDFILDIRKIDINEGNQVIYIQNVIYELDYTLKSYKKKKTSSNSVIKKITQYITFFMEYLLNIDYTFRDDDYEINNPIVDRQLLLDKYNILETILEIISYFMPTLKDIKVRDLSLQKKKIKKRNNNIYNSKNKNDEKLLDTMKLNYEDEKDSALSTMRSMLKLILKFLMHLSENNEDIKQKVFMVLNPILEFSEFIYPKDRSDLLNFIFEILKDSESLQEYIVVGKLKLTKNNKKRQFKPDKVLFIDKILTYIETTYNYLYFYKKLMNLNKIKYKTEEIKEKIKLHIKKVQKEFCMKRKKTNRNVIGGPINYKEIIYITMKTLKRLVIDQIKELHRYLEEKKELEEEKKVNENDKKLKRGNTNFFSKNKTENKDNMYRSAKKVNFAMNPIKEIRSSSTTSNKKNKKKVNLNEDNNEKGLIQTKYQDNAYEAESYDYLNERSPIPQQKKGGILVNKSTLKKSLFNESTQSNINMSKKYIGYQDNELINLYTLKNGEDDFSAFAEKRISDLKLVLSFTKYFQAISFNKILFQKDKFFKDIFGKDIKEEFLENNLNFVINGDSTSINFINGVEYNANSLLGPLFPLRLFNLFFPTLDNTSEDFDTKNIIEENLDDNLSEEEKISFEDDKIYNKSRISNKSNKKNKENDKEKSEEEEEEEEEESDKSDKDSINFNNNSKEIRFSNNDSSEDEIDGKNIFDSPFKTKRNNILNLSVEKDSNNDSEKNKQNIEIMRNKSIRNKSKHQTVNILSKSIIFEKKLKKLLNNDSKQNIEYQRIYEKCKEDDQEINKYLYILYSIYFFCINEYMEIVYKTYTILFNYCINYNYFLDINSIYITLNFVKQNLLPRVIFINNNFIKNIYNKIKLDPTLLNDTFSIDKFNFSENKNDAMNIIENENEDNNIKTDNDEYLNKNQKNKFNRNSGNDFNNKENNKLLFNGNEFPKLKILSKEEIILVDFLIYYCKKNDQINYLFEKIDFFKTLKNLIYEVDPLIIKEKKDDNPINKNFLTLLNVAKFKMNLKKEAISDKKEIKNIKNKFKIILEKIVKKRNEILILYEKLFDVKCQFLLNYKNSLCSTNLNDYGIEKQAEFMIQLLKQYEIENYFNKIIYLEIKNNSNFHDKNSFNKLMNIQEVFKMIEREIQKIKEENETDIKEDITSMRFSTSPRKYIQNKNTENHYKNLNNKLKSITKKNLLNIFSIKEISKEGVIKLVEMLIKENENFFEKIDFANSLKIMVEFIERYDEKKRINNDENGESFILKLNFCKEILRVFIEVKSVFPKFYKLIPENFDVYKNMIINSLECIKDFQVNENSNNNEEEKLFLCICYYSSESLLILLKYCKKSFKDIKDFILEVFEKFKNIYNIFKNPKNKVIFQLFYNYLVTRVLIILNKDKNYDSFLYESFLNNIYPQKFMKIRVNECINELQKSEELSNKEDEEEDGEEEEEESEEENKENKENKEYDAEEEKNDIWKEENLYVTRGKNTDSDEKSLNVGNKLKEVSDNTIGGFGITLQNKKYKNLWENEEEKEKLSFLLFFSSSYIIYLIGKNLGKIRKFLSFDNDKNESYLDDNNFDNKKNESSVQSLRSSSLANLRAATINNRNFNEDGNNSIINNTNILGDEKFNKKKSFITYITKNNKNYNYEIQRQENKLNFELVLFESISGYKYMIKNKNIEIPIKKNKYENIFSNNDSNNNSKSEEEKEEEIVKKNNSRLITFYYYEPNCLEIILLEKIFKEIEIKKNLKYYCTNYYTNEEYESLEKSNLLSELLNLQNRFDSITYQDKEYDILKEQFIKNDMEKFIKKILKNYNEDDLENIDKMQDYIYNIMNEIYPHESLYDDFQSEMVSSLIDSLKTFEEEVQKEYLEKDYEISKKEKVDKSIMHLAQFDLFKFFNSLIYLYPKFNKKICLIFYRIGFQLLYAKCSLLNKNNEKINFNNPQLNLFSVLNGIILLFTRKINHSLIESKNIFFIMVNSINLFFKKIQENHIFIFKNYDLIQELFHKLDFVLNHLSKDFVKIFNFMKSPESQQITAKYKKMEMSLNILITFITTLIGFKKIDKNILTKEINEFSQDIVEKIIKLISILLEKSQETSFQSIDLLLNFIYYFIDGPDIDNLNILFDVGYYDLVSYIIKNIDYYNLFLSNINKEEKLYEIIDNLIEIEYRIIKIFFIYYNICHKEYKKIIGYTKLRHWYDDNIQSIKNKLKRIYYLSKKEMENREYDIDKMLLSLKSKDYYTDEELREKTGTLNFNLENIDDLNEDKIFDENINEKNKKNKKNKENYDEKIENDKDNENNKNINNQRRKNDYCLIKFDLLLLYYTLFSYFQDSINEGYLFVPPKKNLLRAILIFLKECYYFIKNVVLCLYYLVDFFYKHFTIKKKKNIELLQELSDIDKKSQTLDENEMFIFLTNRIKCVEVSLNYILYKIYFPLLNKAKQIRDNNETYLKIDNNQLSNYVNIILSSYDKINLTATQDYKLDKFFEFPFINIIFKNNNLYSTLFILIGILINILIMLSYSTFTETCDDRKDLTKKRLNCPHLLYNDDNEEKTIESVFDAFGICLIVFQIILFLGYIIRRFAQSFGLYRLDYKKKKLLGQRSGHSFTYFFYFIPDILIIIFDFQTIYYLLSIVFLCLGKFIHPFFYCFAFLELVNRVEIMQAVLKAMYVPLANILITLLMFIMLEYFFSMFALTQFTTHFQNENDSKTFLNAFMRMIDQTFKQDGGIGTYLDQTRDPNYQPYVAKSYVGGRFFFDLLFFLLVNTLIFQMFLSMIIDYFTTTKENKEEFQKLSNSQCLICKIEREDLERLYSNLKNAFELHVNHFHSLIDYIAYLVYLQSSDLKDPIIDERVWKLHLSNNFKYLPKNTCFKKVEKRIEKNMKDE